MANTIKTTGSFGIRRCTGSISITTIVKMAQSIQTIGNIKTIKTGRLNGRYCSYRCANPTQERKQAVAQAPKQIKSSSIKALQDKKCTASHCGPIKSQGNQVAW